MPCCKNLRISDSSVRPLQRDRSGTSLVCPVGTPKTVAAQTISLNKQTQSQQPWPPRTHALSTVKKKELRRDQTNKKLGKQNNISSAETVTLSIILYKAFPLQVFQIHQTLPTSQSSLHTAQPFLSKNVLTCQCRSSPPEGPAPVRAA